MRVGLAGERLPPTHVFSYHPSRLNPNSEIGWGARPPWALFSALSWKTAGALNWATSHPGVATRTCWTRGRVQQRPRRACSPMSGFGLESASANRKGRGWVARGTECGAVLLEVVLALVLFVAAAAVISGGLHASIESVERLKLSAHAADLAVSVLSELQMGARSTDMLGPEPFEEPFADWTWEIQLLPVDESEDTDMSTTTSLTKVEVIIRHETPPVTYRLTQVVRLGEAPSTEEGFDANSSF